MSKVDCKNLQVPFCSNTRDSPRNRIALFLFLENPFFPDAEILAAQ